MKILHAFFMSFGMFTAIPCPYRPWDDDARPLMILFFPIIGLILGALWLLAAKLMQLLCFPQILFCALMTLLPYALTGFLHLDGYMDVSDAVLSRRNLEERRRILKDPHVGSFAVIMVCCLLLIHFSLFASIGTQNLISLLILPMTVRACAGIAVTVLRPMKTSQYSGNFQSNRKASYILILGIQLLISLLSAYFFAGRKGLICCIAGSAVYWLATLWGSHNLNGMNGDISGFSLVLGELAGVAAMTFLGG